MLLLVFKNLPNQASKEFVDPKGLRIGILYTGGCRALEERNRRFVSCDEKKDLHVKVGTSVPTNVSFPTCRHTTITSAN